MLCCTFKSQQCALNIALPLQRLEDVLGLRFRKANRYVKGLLILGRRWNRHRDALPRVLQPSSWIVGLETQLFKTSPRRHVG